MDSTFQKAFQLKVQYADDTCLVSNGPSSCTELLRTTEKWLKWSGMRPAVKKCQCVSIQGSTGRVVDPGLTLSGEKIPYVGSKPVHFLGGTIQIPVHRQIGTYQIQEKMRSLLSQVDATSVTRKQISIQGFTGRVVDPGLTLSGQKIPYVGSKPVHFFGGTIQIPVHRQIARYQIQEKMRCLLS